MAYKSSSMYCFFFMLAMAAAARGTVATRSVAAAMDPYVATTQQKMFESSMMGYHAVWNCTPDGESEYFFGPILQMFHQYVMNITCNGKQVYYAEYDKDTNKFDRSWKYFTVDDLVGWSLFQGYFSKCSMYLTTVQGTCGPSINSAATDDDGLLLLKADMKFVNKTIENGKLIVRYDTSVFKPVL